MRIALATCVNLPEPDPDQPLLLAALRRAGVEAEMVSWDDPAVDLTGFDACIIRSTWNYYHRQAEFMDWLARAAAATRLLNPLEIVRWNIHKSYLLELESRGGLPIVPTEWALRGESAKLRKVLDFHGWRDVVIKPAVSAGSWRTRRFAVSHAEGTAEAQGFLDELCRERDALIQPYMKSVEAGGERSLVWIAGAWTHAITKSPRLSGDVERIATAGPVSADESGLGDRALRLAGGELLYARLDLIRDEAGRSCVSELELIEPSLFFVQHPPALERFVRAISGIS